MTQPAKQKAVGPAEGQPQQGEGATDSAQQAKQKGPDQPRPAVVPKPGKPHQPGPKPQQPAKAPPRQPQGDGSRQRPPAKAAKLQRRHWLVMISFGACVILPSVLAALYLWLVAADQYASRVGFTVRQEDAASAVELLGGLSNFSTSSSSDTDILYEFIQSQKLVSEIDDELDLRGIWSRPDWDPVFRLDPDASIEALVGYWEDMVKISYSSGLIEVEVRAFRAEDATRIAQLLLDKSSDVINELSAVAREDAIGYARDELNEAVERLKSARETVTRFRNENQIVDPQLDLQSQAGLLGNLQTQEAEQIIELDLLRETAQDNDPRVSQGERRLRVIRSRIAAERQKLGFEGDAGQAFADLVGEYERLVVDREFAEQSYVSALAAYDGALAEVKRKSRYLAAYMQPTSAQTAEYPQRVVLLLVVTLFLFLIWATVVLVLYAVKDRR
ncbi:hypothetical protein [Salipiger abyssi]|uniref:hypothetical protein n=1 Tax=Salipiger abyssi TaxID=1250539 RepID=UPI001A8E2630|nr:hypothetical protein [Salipiger abyssi]MBN9889813.1 hypothetical protein [Salipiger abyssi]